MIGMKSNIALSIALLFLLTVVCLPAGAAQLSSTHPPRITVEQVKEMLDRGEQVLLVDVRAQGQWASSGHKAKGAVRIENAGDLQELVKTYPPDTPIVTYCT